MKSSYSFRRFGQWITTLKAPGSSRTVEAAAAGYGGEWLMEEEPAPDLFEPVIDTPNLVTSTLSEHANPETSEGVLAASHLRKFYKTRRVVEDVSLHVRRGEAVGLLGPNGAGKTTVFYMITGLIRPDQGNIFLDGHDVTPLPMYRRARLGVGYLPQEASIFRGLSVEDNIRAVLEISQPDKHKRAEELESLLDEFDIKRLRKSPSIALSGGERRRCEIARALAGKPAFMLLDEPFAGVDPIAVNDIKVLVRHLTQRGIGVLITDHAVRETLGLIDRAYIIHSGHVLTDGTPDEIVAHEDVRRFYLGADFRL
ncbi:LPS export ABC transporter ATP-binding protein [Beijerinckia indica]|uniref:Lipopolysaccharide export system ATP-binding protein LptB n=1 Tax=Beijerinckia indica subsp. indica (strain ATCC 9039 / DSM 1715 / NCIMB 8712) TaxID=395963 RepID=B2IFK9_BEII9|nr:ABC transporter related [Beijerinckia indica subsp. indica ATCC 9039]